MTNSALFLAGSFALVVEGTLPAVTSVRSMLGAIASSPSFLGDDAGAVLASLDAFLEKARRS